VTSTSSSILMRRGLLRTARCARRSRSDRRCPYPAAAQRRAKRRAPTGSHAHHPGPRRRALPGRDETEILGERVEVPFARQHDPGVYVAGAHGVHEERVDALVTPLGCIRLREGTSASRLSCINLHPHHCDAHRRLEQFRSTDAVSFTSARARAFSIRFRTSAPSSVFPCASRSFMRPKSAQPFSWFFLRSSQ
jgi:hypothetical protein